MNKLTKVSILFLRSFYQRKMAILHFILWLKPLDCLNVRNTKPRQLYAITLSHSILKYGRLYFWRQPLSTPLSLSLYFSIYLSSIFECESNSFSLSLTSILPFSFRQVKRHSNCQKITSPKCDPTILKKKYLFKQSFWCKLYLSPVIVKI
jgi:hypothetical protein